MIATFFRHGSNAAITVFLLIAAGLFSTGRVGFSLLGALVGAAIFISSEYGTHRFLFHAKPARAGWIRALQHRLHYDHHIDPPKLELLFLPLWFVVPVGLLYEVLFLAVTRDAALAFSMTAGSLAALLYYEWVHYVAHVPFTPRTPFGKYMKKYHLWHHFKNEHFWFGVTNPAMDLVATTFRDHDSVPRSTTVREIWR